MQYTASELIKQAEKLSQTQNSRAFDWAFKVSLLNNVYTNVYNELTAESNAFIKYFSFNGNECDLPNDCNKVCMVYQGNEANPYVLNQSSIDNPIPGSYYIENNVLKIANNVSGEIKVKYSSMPVVLTAPDEPEVLNIDYDEITGLDDEYVYYSKSGTSYRYSLKDMSSEKADTPTKNNTFLNKPFDTENLTWNDEDVKDYFTAYDMNTGEEINVEKIVFDNTHIAVTYDNGDVYVVTADWNKVIINPYLYKGRYFKGKAVAICGDDSTGKGMLCESNGQLLYMSFVPDTVLDYPLNVFFEYLIDLYAVQIQGLVGLDNNSLQTKLTNDEMSFQQSIQRSHQGVRIRNDSNIHKRGWL